MYLLEYLTRRVHPFGFMKEVCETLPRKLTLQEIISAADTESNSLNFGKLLDFFWQFSTQKSILILQLNTKFITT
jgi:hypothetical protein